MSGHDPGLIGMVACATSHYWGRELAKFGHTVKLMPPAYVKPYVKRGKNDATDATGNSPVGEPAEDAVCPGQHRRLASVLMRLRTRALRNRQ